jgi:hypothetical protein
MFDLDYLDMKLLLLLQKDYDLCCQLQTLWINIFAPDIKSQIENGLAKSDFAIAQLLYFNNHKKGQKTQVNTRDIQVTANHLLLFM